MFLLAKAAHDTCLGGSAATCNNTQSNINRIYQKKMVHLIWQNYVKFRDK